MQIEYPYENQSTAPRCAAYVRRDTDHGQRCLGMAFALNRAFEGAKWPKIGAAFDRLIASKTRFFTGKKVRRAADKKRRTSLVRTARISHQTGTRTTETENQNWFDRALFVSKNLGAYSNAH